MQFAPHRTTANQVRTGMVIRTVWCRPLVSLEVDVVHHEQFVTPEGVTHQVVRFTGWELFNGQPVRNGEGRQMHRVINGWGQVVTLHAEVSVEADRRARRRQCSLTFGALSGRADAARLQVELETFLAGLPGA